MRIVLATAFVVFAAAPVIVQPVIAQQVIAQQVTAQQVTAQPVMTQAALPDVIPNFLKKEPYFLSPRSVVFVDNGACGVGKVLKVTGALGPLRRKKLCVPMGREEASRAFATP